MDSRVLEWARIGRVAVETCTALQSGEKAVLVTDTKIHEFMGARELIDAVWIAAVSTGAEVTMVEFLARDQPNGPLPEAAAAAMKTADVVYTFPTRPPSHTKATREARDNGARILMLASGTSVGNDDVLYRLAPRSGAEIDSWARLTTTLKDRFLRGGRLHVTTERGTDLSCQLGQLEVHTMDGICTKPGTLSHFIPGLAGGGPDPASTEGVLIVDAGITPIWRPLANEEPVRLTIKAGRVVDVAGGPAAREWKALADELDDPDVFSIAEYGFGCHPRATTPHGRPMEDERLYGGFHVGIGSNTSFGGSVQTKWHIDASAVHATATLDDEVLVRDGVYQV
jgi:2,5-dihydroxypyridine 5,6-dioxygenase